eukprot:6182593-Prymnesium_polylepis.1
MLPMRAHPTHDPTITRAKCFYRTRTHRSKSNERTRGMWRNAPRAVRLGAGAQARAAKETERTPFAEVLLVRTYAWPPSGCPPGEPPPRPCTHTTARHGGTMLPLVESIAGAAESIGVA